MTYRRAQAAGFNVPDAILVGRFSGDNYWPPIRAKALSRTEMSGPVYVTPRVSQRRLRTKALVFHAESPLGERNRSTNHRYGLNCNHDSSMRTSSRRSGAKVENIVSFSKAVGRLLHRSAGCESAHSVFRSSFRRPRPTPSCSRCERSPDTWCWCVASRRVVRAAATLATPFGMRWQRCKYCLRNPLSKRVTVCALSTSKVPRKLLPCLLIAPSRCLPPELCSRGISPKARDLLAALETRHVPQGQHEGQ
jgi:hypothetical protein